MTNAEFAESVRRMSEVQGGELDVQDFYPGDASRRPYRYASLRVLALYADAGARAAELTALAIAIQGHATIMTHYSLVAGPACQIEVLLSRDLDDDQLRIPGTHSLLVPLSTFGLAVRS